MNNEFVFIYLFYIHTVIFIYTILCTSYNFKLKEEKLDCISHHTAGWQLQLYLQVYRRASEMTRLKNEIIHAIHSMQPRNIKGFKIVDVAMVYCYYNNILYKYTARRMIEMIVIATRYITRWWKEKIFHTSYFTVYSI